MNYRHSYHAGNFADVLKHAVMALVIDHLKRKDTPFRVLDTHAGRGLYDLGSPEAAKTGEAANGIVRLLAEPDPPAALAPYLDAVTGLNGGGEVRRYPGSPWLARRLMRPADRLVAAELHPEDAAALAAQFRRDRQVAVHRADGYRSVKAFLPPPERRGLTLIDPPFEEPGEFERLADALIQARRRFATGIVVAWYPIKDPAPVARFHQEIQGMGDNATAVIELLVRAPMDRLRLNGCGLVVVNPPWQLAETVAELLPFLSRVLAQEAGAGGHVDWLVGAA